MRRQWRASRRIDLQFGVMELRPAGSRDDFGQDPPQRLIGKCDLGWKALLVLGERDEVRERWPVGARKRIPARIEDGMAELSRAVRPKVEEDDAVTVSHSWNGLAAGRHDPGWLEELVGGSGVVALPDEGNRIRRRGPRSLDHGTVGKLGTIPTLVALPGHGAAAHGRAPAAPDPFQLRTSVLHEPGGTGRWFVAAIGEGMDVDPRQAQLLCHLHPRDQVRQGAVDAA